MSIYRGLDFDQKKHKCKSKDEPYWKSLMGRQESMRRKKRRGKYRYETRANTVGKIRRRNQSTVRCNKKGPLSPRGTYQNNKNNFLSIPDQYIHQNGPYSKDYRSKKKAPRNILRIRTSTSSVSSLQWYK